MRAARLLPFALLCALAACGGGQRLAPSAGLNAAPPGPASDPWGPYIREAGNRFSIPDRWIREVMRQESGGHEYLHGHLTTSDAGAMGLMQIMPATYEMLRARYNLGDDPYDPHDNITAGAGYIRELYDKYGAPGFLAAYNAGPQRLEDYNAGRAPLPHETVDYVASIAPRLGSERPLTGPLAAYADGGAPVEVASAPPTPSWSAQAGHPRLSASNAACWHDPDRAYDPDAPCETPPAAARASAPPASPSPTLVATAPQVAAPIATPSGSLPPPVPYGAAPAIALAQAAPLPSWSAKADRPRLSAPLTNCWHDPDRAYDPDAPCQAPPPPADPAVTLAQATPPRSWSAKADHPRLSAPPAAPAVHLASATAPGTILWSEALRPATTTAPRAPRHFSLIPTATASELHPLASDRRWGIELGAFPTAARARAEAEAARGATPILAGSHPTLATTTPFGGHPLYRARLTGLSNPEATAACRHLTPCIEVPPGG